MAQLADGPAPPDGSNHGPAVHSPDDEFRIDRSVAAAEQCWPDNAAIAATDGELTYRDLLARAGLLAARLHELGVREGSLVGLCCPRSASLVVGALAILQCGAAYVALDPEAPTDRLRFMLADCGAAFAVVTAASQERLGPVVRTVEIGPGGRLGVDASAPLAREPADVALPQASKLQSGLAYVVYTSGSTGHPKGVLVDHGGLGQLVSWHLRAFGVTAADRATQVASPAFDAWAWEVWPHLVAGACLVIPDERSRLDTAALRDFIVDQRIDVAFVPTALAEPMLVLAWPAATRLRFLLTGGDALQAAPPAGLPFVLVNNYGLSEATVVSTSGVVEPGTGSPAIGRAIDGADLSVVDDRLIPVAAGDVGELIVAGSSVARGYLNRPELDSARFIADPERPGRRRLRTGDLVRRRIDGQLEFLGRVDDQVQVRGFRIELAEIVTALSHVPGISSAHVLVAGERTATRQLHAYLVAHEPDRPSIADLRSELGRTLPHYMIPAAFTWLAELPVTANGKVDRAALAAHAAAPAGPTPAAGESADGNWEDELTAAVATLVADLLEVDEVAGDDDFFTIGGHSLLGAQLVGRVADRFGVELHLRDVFDHPTVAGMSGRIAELIVADVDAAG